MKNRRRLLIGGGIAAFICLAAWALGGYSLAFETAVYRLLHALPDGFGAFFLFITRLGNTGFVLLLLAVFLAFNRRLGRYVLLDAALSTALNRLLKGIFQRSRPDFTHLVQAGGYSFPSGHAMISVSLYGFLLYLTIRHVSNSTTRRLLSVLLAALMVLIPMSRIYLGVHYASDVLAGSLASAMYLCVFLHWYTQRERTSAALRTKSECDEGL